MRTILYQAYGSSGIRNEVLFSLVSLLPYLHEDQYQVIIYTDDSGHFNRPFLSELRISFRPLTAERLQEWQGEDQNPNRLKIKLIEDFLEQGGTEAIYLDADTIFTANPALLFERLHRGFFCLYRSEGLISDVKNPLFQKVIRFLRNNQEHVDELPFSNTLFEMTVYNTGIVGFDYRLGSVVQEVLRLNDGLYELYPKPIIERLAFSLILQKNFILEEAKPVVFHYSNLDELRPLLHDFFEAFGESDAKAISEKAKRILPQRLMEDKNRFFTTGRNQLRKLLGLAATYKAPDFKTLMQQISP